MKVHSLIEGCSMSVLLCNILSSALAKRVEQRSPEVKATFYVDDSKMRAIWEAPQY